MTKRVSICAALLLACSTAPLFAQGVNQPDRYAAIEEGRAPPVAPSLKQRWLDEADAACPEDERLPCRPVRFERPAAGGKEAPSSSKSDQDAPTETELALLRELRELKRRHAIERGGAR